MATDPAPNPVPATPAPRAEAAPVVARAVPAAAPSPARAKRGWFAQLLGSGGADDQIIVYHHSQLFYWWPVWLIGFVFAGWTAYFGGKLAVVPEGTQAAMKRQVDVNGDGKELAERDVLILPRGKTF